MSRDEERDGFSAELEEQVRRVLSDEVCRRDFLKKAGRVGGAVLLGGSLVGFAASCGSGAGSGARRAASSATTPAASNAGTAAADLAVAVNDSPGNLARKAVDAVGGMKRFVKAGNTVVVKANAAFASPPSSATSTNPEVVAQVITMCREAGASRVILLDHVLAGMAESCLARNGIGAAARGAGAEVIVYSSADDGHGVDTPIPDGVSMKSASVYPEVLNADVVITVPKAKNHGGAGLSLGMKNFIGVTARMSDVHDFGLHQAIADLNTLVRPNLSVVDASSILLENGPGGPGPVKQANTVIASPDVVAADSYACTLFGMTANDVEYIVNGAKAGLGQMDLNRLKIARV